MNEPQPNVKLLVRWLGLQGAKAGITESKLWTVEVLRSIAAELGIQVYDKTPRKDLIDVVLQVANRRIDKPLSALYDMEAEDLMRYFESVGVETQELLELLKEMEVAPRKEGRKNLMEFAARELAETGRFMRIAGK